MCRATCAAWRCRRWSCAHICYHASCVRCGCIALTPTLPPVRKPEAWCSSRLCRISPVSWRWHNSYRTWREGLGSLVGRACSLVAANRKANPSASLDLTRAVCACDERGCGGSSEPPTRSPRSTSANVLRKVTDDGGLPAAGGDEAAEVLLAVHVLAAHVRLRHATHAASGGAAQAPQVLPTREGVCVRSQRRLHTA